MKVGFLGLGKLGLPVALAIESKGHEVCGTKIISEFLTTPSRSKTCSFVFFR